MLAITFKVASISFIYSITNMIHHSIGLTVNSFSGFFEKAFGSIKSALISIGIINLAVFYSPTVYPFLVCFGFILVDLIFGIASAKKNVRENKITATDEGYLSSRRSWNTVNKFLVTAFTLVLAHTLDIGIIQEYFGESLKLMAVAAGIIASCEFLSWLEHCIDLFPNIKWIQLFRKIVKAKSEKYLDITIDREDYTEVKKATKKKIK